MFLCFKDLRIAYYCLASLGIFFYFPCFTTDGVTSFGCFLLGSFLMFVWAVTMAVVLSVVCNKRFKAKLKLFDAGHPQEYATFLERLLLDKQKPINRNHLLLDLSSAYCHQGRVQEAFDLLMQVDLSVITKSYHIQRLVYFNNLSMCYLETKDYGRMKHCLENLCMELESPQCNQYMRNQIKPVYLSKNILLKFLCDELSPSEARAALEACGFETDSVRSQTWYRFWIAKTYLAQEDYENAKAYLILAAEEGLELYEAVQARQLLEQNYPRPVRQNQTV